jgi:hypothetical protein
MTYQPKKTQTRALFKIKLFEIHRRVFLDTVSPEIILPKDSYIVFDTTLDSTDPIEPAIFMCGLEMTL